MSKQSDIREALGRDIGFGIVKDIPTDEIVDTVLRSLHSQGVVIKVDGELPDEGMGTYEATRGAQLMYNKLKQAGYVAVESLQEA